MINDCKLIDFDYHDIELDDADFQLGDEKECDLYYEFLMKMKEQTYESQQILTLTPMDDRCFHFDDKLIEKALQVQIQQK